MNRKTEKYRKFARDYEKKVRNIVLKKYGGSCKCCGENKYEFLVFHNLNGSGKKFQKLIKMNLVHWLRKNNYPRGFKLLCHNCNMAKYIHGICPHKKLKRSLR